MAITKIHAIKATVHKAVDYICNPAKTDESILISSFGCSPQTAAFDFKFALSHTSEADPNKAFHLIQAFSPGEVSYKEAHQIGVALADKLLEGKCSYVVATHIDKGHLHNHIIFCAADNINHEKYHDCKRSYYHIRGLSDELCREHNLSIIEPSGKRGKSYPKWQEEKNLKDTLKSVIDSAIHNATSYEECMELIRSQGYEIKGDKIDDSHLKAIAFRPHNHERFIRGSERTLGIDYTRERIKERIEQKERKAPSHAIFPQKSKPLVRNYSGKKLIDTSDEKFTNSSGLKHWADIQNLKIAAASYSAADSTTALEQQIATTTSTLKVTKDHLLQTERQLKELGEILKYAEQYKANHIYHVRYQKSKNREEYFRSHEMELLLHDGAETMLKRYGIDFKSVNPDALKAHYNTLYSQKERLRRSYKQTQSKITELNQNLDNIRQYLNKSASPDLTTAQVKRESTSL